MSKPKCPRCGEINLPGVTTCWTCGQTGLPVDAPGSASPVEAAQRDPLNEYGTVLAVSGAILLAAGATVTLGVLMEAPGLGIFLAIVTLPAFVRTGLVVRRRSDLGKPVSRGQQAWLFVGSLATSVVVAVVVWVAAVGTFCAVCLSVYEVRAFPISLVIGTVCLGALVAMVAWIRRRWQRDVWER